MKDANKVIDKLIAYARENLMLDALDEAYTRNRLSALFGIAPAKADEAAVEFGSAAELAAAVAEFDNVTIDAVMDVIMPAPHTVDYYFTDEMNRSPQKAFDFLFELYSCAMCVDAANAEGKDGYSYYTPTPTAAPRPVMLDAGNMCPYTPRVAGNRIATLACDDVFCADIVARLGAYVSAYGGAIAKTVGEDGDYACCNDIAPAHAAVKKQLADGAVKIALLDYPVTALSFSGIAKNAVERAVASTVKHAADAGVACTVACARDKSASHTFYIIFAGGIASDDVITPLPVLGPCGVFTTVQLSDLLSVLEKGTALSTDLFAFKPVYSSIGGVKHGAKAKAVLTDALIDIYKKLLGGAASATEDRAAELVGAAADKA